VLDLGAGAGAHALPLSGRGLAVTATEILPDALEVLTESGVADVRAGGLETVRSDERFDSVLCLMNGLGFAATLGGLPAFLESLATVLAPGGQILADSTDPRDWGDPEDGRYPGEVHMQLEFEGKAGPPFPFLFVDPDTLATVAAGIGMESAVVSRTGDQRYLARLAVRP
jgi:SAM-dependent methyltransferase